MISKIKKKLDDIIWRTDMTSVRLSIVLGSIFWAILLMWPGQLFTPSRTTYRLMSEIASENIWALAFLVHASCALTTLFTDIRNKFLFFGDAIWGSILWTSATIACFASHWQYGKEYAPPAAMSAELALMLAAWWWVIKWIVREQEEKRRG